MEKEKVILAASKETVNALKKQIHEAAFNLIESSFSGNEVLRKTASLAPDIVISDYTLSDMTGLNLAQSIAELKICPVIILASAQEREHVEALENYCLDIFCSQKPISQTDLNQTISLSIKLAKKIHEYEYQIDSLKKQLEERKIIEKAKGILMKKFKMTEDAAYKEMRSKAMNLSKPLAEIAKTIVETFKLFEQTKY
jgi:response regulator NasT